MISVLLFCRQLALADRIILNKIDLVDKEQVASLKKRIK